MTDKKISVLVVEDEPLVRINIVAELEDQGVDVIEASNAAEAIALLADNPVVNVMFTDVNMPGNLDGIELARIVNERYPPIQVVVTSGYRHDIADQLPAGDKFVPKPYIPEHVVQTILDLASHPKK